MSNEQRQLKVNQMVAELGSLIRNCDGLAEQIADRDLCGGSEWVARVKDIPALRAQRFSAQEERRERQAA